MAAEFERGGSPSASGSPFESVDPRLTVYALANGMDLTKEAGFRRLEWYRDGRDRGILVTATADDALDVTAMAWSGDPAAAQQASLRTAIAPDDLVTHLTIVLDGATEAANTL